MAVASDGGEDHGGEVRGRRRRLRGLRHVREDESESRPVRQCDAVWCDAVWCDAVQCSAVRCAVWLLPTTDLWRRVGRQVVEHADDVEGPCGSTQWASGGSNPTRAVCSSLLSCTVLMLQLYSCREVCVKCKPVLLRIHTPPSLSIASRLSSAREATAANAAKAD